MMMRSGPIPAAMNTHPEITEELEVNIEQKRGRNKSGGIEEVTANDGEEEEDAEEDGEEDISGEDLESEDMAF